MSTEKSTVAELDDVENKVYAFGLNLDQYSRHDLDDLMELLEDRFDHAECIILNLPIEGSVEISELEREEFMEMIGYENIFGDFDRSRIGDHDG